jgi:hypothetical protein
VTTERTRFPNGKPLVCGASRADSIPIQPHIAPRRVVRVYGAVEIGKSYNNNGVDRTTNVPRALGSVGCETIGAWAEDVATLNLAR